MFINLMRVLKLKKMAGRFEVLCFFALIILFSSLSFSSALLATLTNTTGTIERALPSVSSTNLVNFTIGAISENITRLTFTISGAQMFDPDKFIIDSNGTSAFMAYFVNSSGNISESSRYLTLIFTNVTPAGIIPNGTTRTFWFNINSRSMSAAMINVVANATGISGESNYTNTLSWPFTFRFSGYVKNETGSLQSGTNVSIWSFAESQNGPIETLISQTQTGSAGNFSLAGIDSRGGLNYKLKIVHYNSSNPSQALKVGTNLPAFPAEMYYPKTYQGDDIAPQFEFMRQPSLNGTSFYLGPAATLNISATNGTDAQRFGYMVMEQGTGFPLESSGNTNVTSVQIVVPLNRAYTVMAMRNNNIFANDAGCVSGSFMNDTACRTPPKSNSTIRPSVDGEIININIDLSVSRKYMFGCINAAGNSSAITNVSLILPKMMPWPGFVPPARADTQDIDLGTNVNYNSVSCPGKIAWYNISVLNSDYFVEFYGRNDVGGSGGEFVGALQNASFTSSSQNINITLSPLAGAFSAATAGEIVQGTGTNTTKFTIRVQNASGSAITQDKPHIEVTLRNSSVFGEVTYIAEATNGSFSIIIPSGLIGKVKVFSNNAPPKEKSLNLSQTELNISLINMQGGDGGFKRKNASGQLEMMNISDDSFNVAMGFFRAGGSCDSIAPDSNCNLTSMGARNFNPFIALVAGKVNMQMRLSSGVSIMFYNFDMFAAKQPPMESVMNNQAVSGGSSANQSWEFGSFVPADVYDYAVVTIPYNDSTINDSADIRMGLPYLYDENWNIVYNSTRGDTSANITTSVDDYLGNVNNRSFNSTGYRTFLEPSGVLCNKTNNSIAGSSPTVYCYADTTNNLIYMRVPHFSGVSPLVSGSSPSTDSGSSSSSTSSGGGVSTYSTYSYDEKDFSLYSSVNKLLGRDDKIKIKINNESHSVTIASLNSNYITVTVASTAQSATFNIGESKKFEISGDSYYDLLIKLNSISNNKADLSVSYLHELISTAPSPVTETSAASAAPTVSNGPSNEETQDSGSGAWFYIILIFVIAIIVIIIYFMAKASSKGLNSRVNVVG